MTSSQAWFREETRRAGICADDAEESQARHRAEHTFTDDERKAALKYRDTYWSGGWLREPEDTRIDALRHACRIICGGDRRRGWNLAFEAIHS